MGNNPPWLSDWSNRTMLLMHGEDGVDFLQRLSTNDMKGLTIGPVRTVLANEKGKIIDVLAAAQLKPDVLLLAGISKDPRATKSWLEKFIIMEDIKVEVAAGYRHFLIGGEVEYEGPRQAIQYRDEWGRHYLDSGSSSGAWLEGAMAELRILDEEGLDRYRIMEGIPEWHTELSQEYNPLEARLDSLVSWTKGCYVGQEVIARLDTYKKVQRLLVTLLLEGKCAVPGTLFLGETEVGVLTSAAVGEDGRAYGIGYLKASYAKSNQVLKVRSNAGETRAELREH